jgi:dUTP pyrophosphatase
MKVMLDSGAYMPERAHDLDAGYDLRMPDGLDEVTLYGGSAVIIDTGVHMEIPQGHVGFIKSKSGLNVKNDLTATGVVDAGYTGSIVVKLYNHGRYIKKFNSGDKLTQIVILPIFTPDLELVDSLDKTERGNNGFGSTGV